MSTLTLIRTIIKLSGSDRLSYFDEEMIDRFFITKYWTGNINGKKYKNKYFDRHDSFSGKNVLFY